MSCGKIIHQFYKNRLQFKEWLKFEQTERSDPHSDPPRPHDAAPITTTTLTLDHESDDLRGLVAPLLKLIQGRARSASCMWAEEHEARVKEHKRLPGGARGTHQMAVSDLYHELAADEKAKSQARADTEKAALLEDPDLCFK